MKKQTYQNYELNKRQLDISTLMKIADIFKVSLDYLCDRPNSNCIGFYLIIEKIQFLQFHN